jgi:hypothetical protein
LTDAPIHKQGGRQPECRLVGYSCVDAWGSNKRLAFLRKPENVQMEEAAVQLYQEGRTLAEVGRRIGRNTNAVLYILLRRGVNSWVEQQTREKIKDLLALGTVTADTRLVLTNAVYFKGKWSHPFGKEATREEDFLPAGGRKDRTSHRPGWVASGFPLIFWHDARNQCLSGLATM